MTEPMFDVTRDAEKSAEIVATCEAAVSHLTNPEAGWTRGSYTNGEVAHHTEDGQYVEDYTHAQACLGGALALANYGTAKTIGGTFDWCEEINSCPAIPAVAAVILKRYPLLLTNGIPDEHRADSTAESTIYMFNDEVATSVEDVVEVLNETIKRHTSETVEP